MMSLSGAIAASFFITYRTTVEAPATIRPVGEPRLVQSGSTGPVVNIQAENNALVKKGDVLAKIDTASLEERAIQLLANLDRGKIRLSQLNAQLVSADQQLAAEVAQAQREVMASAADYTQTLRANRDRSISAQSAVQEAQAELALAVQEVNSFTQLAESGAISRLQLSEKQASLATAEARMTSLKAALNPSQGEVQAASARVSQAQAGGRATIARLEQAKQQLNLQRLELQEQLQVTEQDIAQVNLELQNSIVRSPATGIIHELSLRNIGQVVNLGETLAKVIPETSALVIKASVPTSQINKVELGFATQMRVSACPFSEFGTLEGRVKEISPDLSTAAANRTDNSSSSANSVSTYSISIEINTPFLVSKSGETCELLAGMEGQAVITSRKETVINFLLRKASLLRDSNRGRL